MQSIIITGGRLFNLQSAARFVRFEQRADPVSGAFGWCIIQYDHERRIIAEQPTEMSAPMEMPSFQTWPIGWSAELDRKVLIADGEPLVKWVSTESRSDRSMQDSSFHLSLPSSSGC